MITVHLDEDKCWKGVIYLAGDREIPEDLAEILGLIPATTSNSTATTSKPEPKDVRKPTSKPSKSEGESGGN